MTMQTTRPNRRLDAFERALSDDGVLRPPPVPSAWRVHPVMALTWGRVLVALLAGLLGLLVGWALWSVDDSYRPPVAETQPWQVP